MPKINLHGLEVELTLDELIEYQARMQAPKTVSIPATKATPPSPRYRTRYLPTQEHLEVFEFIRDYGPCSVVEMIEYLGDYLANIPEDRRHQWVSNKISVMSRLTKRTEPLLTKVHGTRKWTVTEAVRTGALVAVYVA